MSTSLAISPLKARRTAKRLLKAKRDGTSYRSIERHGYHAKGIDIKPGVNNATLSRIATSKGAWMPKDIEILKLLGIYKQPHRRLKYISEMKEHELLAALRDRVPCPAPSPAIIKAFRKLGWLKRTRVTA